MPAKSILAFRLDHYRFGVLESEVVAVERLVEIQPLSRDVVDVEGVVNYHGTVLAVFDLKPRFRIPSEPAHPNQHLVVARAHGHNVGLRVDAVLGLLQVEEEDIESPDATSPKEKQLLGVVRLPDGLLLIHDLDRILTEQQERELNELLSAAATADTGLQSHPGESP